MLPAVSGTANYQRGSTIKMSSCCSRNQMMPKCW